MDKNITDFINDISSAETVGAVQGILFPRISDKYDLIDLTSPEEAAKYYEGFITAVNRVLDGELKDLRPVGCSTLASNINSTIRDDENIPKDNIAEIRALTVKLTSLSAKLYRGIAECKLWGMMDVKNTFARVSDPDMKIDSSDVERLYLLSVEFMSSNLVGKHDEYQMLGIAAIAQKVGVKKVDTEH